MFNFKLDVKDLGNIVGISITLLIVIALLMAFLSPLLVTILPTIFAVKLSLVEVLLFLILVRLYVK